MGIFSSKPSKDVNPAAENSPAPKKTPRELIAEKYRKQRERSQFIQEEIKRVRQFHQEIKAKYSKE